MISFMFGRKRNPQYFVVWCNKTNTVTSYLKGLLKHILHHRGIYFSQYLNHFATACIAADFISWKIGFIQHNGGYPLLRQRKRTGHSARTGTGNKYVRIYVCHNKKMNCPLVSRILFPGINSGRVVIYLVQMLPSESVGQPVPMAMRATPLPDQNRNQDLFDLSTRKVYPPDILL